MSLWSSNLLCIERIKERSFRTQRENQKQRNEHRKDRWQLISSTLCYASLGMIRPLPQTKVLLPPQYLN